ncbi:MAG: hypothetical protein WBC44_02825 [Planctomycetaceae bacterium]
MPISVAEAWDSRETTISDDSSVELRYVIRGTDDDATANSSLLAAAPILYGGLIRQSAHTARIAEDAWEGTVRYGQIRSTGDSSFSFDTGGGSQHLTQSLSTVGSYAPPDRTAPDFRGAIGVTSDAVEGIDVTVPVYHFSETHYLANAVVTPAYKAALFFLTGSANNAPFKGFSAGEVLFLGASGSKRGSEDWEISFKFAASPNAADLSVGDISGITKAGWDYLWVRYEDAEDETAKALVKRPVAAYVERVYPWGNFATLGIGV